MKLETHDVTKVFGTHVILNQISMHIPCFKILAILGPSGSGKSTFLRIMGGLDTPTSGSIALDDKEILFEEHFLLQYRRTIGMVFQSFNLFPHLTVLENIVLPLHRVHALPLDEAIETAMQYLKRFDLQKHAEKKSYQLSGGQRQRVAIVRAMATKVRLLLLDEPTSALDPLMTSEVLDLITESQSERISILLVSHHIGFVKKIADWIAFLHLGTVLEYSPTADFFENPKTDQSQLFLNKVLKY